MMSHIDQGRDYLSNFVSIDWFPNNSSAYKIFTFDYFIETMYSLKTYQHSEHMLLDTFLAPKTRVVSLDLAPN